MSSSRSAAGSSDGPTNAFSNENEFISKIEDIVRRVGADGELNLAAAIGSELARKPNEVARLQNMLELAKFYRDPRGIQPRSDWPFRPLNDARGREIKKFPKTLERKIDKILDQLGESVEGSKERKRSHLMGLTGIAHLSNSFRRRLVVILNRVERDTPAPE